MNYTEEDKWPWFMRLLVAVVVCFAIFEVIAIISQINFTVEYEPLDKYHENIKCRTCHTTKSEARDVAADKCSRIECHPGPKFRKIIPETESPLTQHANGVSCQKCHTIHEGSKAPVSLPFDHQSAEGAKKCGVCHMIPAKHRPEEGKECGDCHNTAEFRDVASN